MTIYSYNSLDGHFWRLPCPDNPYDNSTEPESTTKTKYSSSSSHGNSEFLLSSSNLNSLISDIQASYVETSSPLDDDFDRNDISGDFSIVETKYNLTLVDPLGPLSLPLSSCQLQHLFYKITEIHISFSYKALNVGLAIIPYLWDIELVLTMIAGKVQPTIIITHRISNVIGFSSDDIFSILNFILLILASISGFFAIVSSIRSIRIFIRTKNRYKYYQSAARPGDLVI